jgi:hypothetical protein
MLSRVVVVLILSFAAIFCRAEVSLLEQQEFELAEQFHGLGHFEFLEVHEDPVAKAKPSPKRLQCSCTFKKASAAPSFLEEKSVSPKLRANARN